MGKDILKLKNANEYGITEEAYNILHIVHIAANESAAVALCDDLTAENVSHVEFRKNDVPTPYATYDGLKLAQAPTRSTNEDGTVSVVISLRYPTEVEKLATEVNAIKAEQAEQNDAIDFLTMA